MELKTPAAVMKKSICWLRDDWRPTINIKKKKIKSTLGGNKTLKNQKHMKKINKFTLSSVLCDFYQKALNKSENVFQTMKPEMVNPNQI